MNYGTEDIHPFEMFDHINIHGNATRRIGRQYSGMQKGKRRLQAIGNTGILHCSDLLYYIILLNIILFRF